MIGKAAEASKALPRGRVAGAATPPEVGRHAMQRPTLFALQSLVEESTNDGDDGSSAYDASDPRLPHPDAEACDAHGREGESSGAKLSVTSGSDVAPQGGHFKAAPMLALGFPRLEDALGSIRDDPAKLLKDRRRRQGTLPELVNLKPGLLLMLRKPRLGRRVRGTSTPGHVRARNQSRGAYRPRSSVRHQRALRGLSCDYSNVMRWRLPARWTQARPGRQGSCRRASSAYDRVG